MIRGLVVQQGAAAFASGAAAIRCVVMDGNRSLSKETVDVLWMRALEVERNISRSPSFSQCSSVFVRFNLSTEGQTILVFPPPRRWVLY